MGTQTDQVGLSAGTSTVRRRTEVVSSKKTGSLDARQVLQRALVAQKHGGTVQFEQVLALKFA